MSENQKIILSFKNATDVRLPKKVADELEGIELEVWPGYPQDDMVFLDRLVTYDSSAGQSVIGAYPVIMSELMRVLTKKQLVFSRNWIRKNVPGKFIRISKDCIRQQAKAMV